MSDTPKEQAPQQNATSTPTDVTKAAPAPRPVSPAQDLRDIQYLLLAGSFPGNVAPTVVKAYSLLDKMAEAIERGAEAAKPSEDGKPPVKLEAVEAGDATAK